MLNKPRLGTVTGEKFKCMDRRTITIAFRMELIFLNIFLGEIISKTGTLNNIVLLADLCEKFARIINIEFIRVQPAPPIAILRLITKFIIGTRP